VVTVVVAAVGASRVGVIAVLYCCAVVVL